MIPDAASLAVADPAIGGIARASIAGDGLVELALVGGRTEVVRLRAESPLRLLAPRGRSRHSASPAAWIVTGSYGGGLVSGDRLSIAVRCGDGTRTVLGTQASTKVYRSRVTRLAGLPTACRQAVSVSLGDGAVLVSWPDPITCFAGSRFVQRQSFEMTPTSSLVAVDWLTSGRMARGERWAFDRYESETRIRVNGRLRLRESTTLDPADGSMHSIARTAGLDCLGMTWIVGPAFGDLVDELMRRLERDPIDPRRDIFFAVSRLGERESELRGAVIRFAARSTVAGWQWLRSLLGSALKVVGVDPWARRG